MRACCRFCELRNRTPGLCWSMIFSENRYAARIKSGSGFFGIMLQVGSCRSKSPSGEIQALRDIVRGLADRVGIVHPERPDMESQTRPAPIAERTVGEFAICSDCESPGTA